MRRVYSRMISFVLAVMMGVTALPADVLAQEDSLLRSDLDSGRIGAMYGNGLEEDEDKTGDDYSLMKGNNSEVTDINSGNPQQKKEMSDCPKVTDSFFEGDDTTPSGNDKVIFDDVVYSETDDINTKDTIYPEGSIISSGSHWNGVSYVASYINGEAVLDITGNGIIMDADMYKNDNMPEIIERIVIHEGITGIDSSIFLGYHNLKSVEFPNSMEKIGSLAFSGCKNLTKVNIPSVIELDADCFVGCKSLTEIVLPQNIEVIGDRAFWQCNSLKTVHVKGLLKEIGYCAFCDCTQLTNDSVEELLHPGLKLGGSVFNGCNSITTVDVPDGIERIRYNNFSCDNLVEISVPDAEWIRECGYYNNLERVTIRGGDRIPARLFCRPQYNSDSLNENLKSIVLPDSIEIIEKNAFEHCVSLKEITIPNRCDIIEEEAFIGCLNLEKIIMPETMEDIGYSAFEDCQSIKTISIPKGISELRGRVFQNCFSLEKVYIPDNVKKIAGGDPNEGGSFRGCKGLCEVSLPMASEDLVGMLENTGSSGINLVIRGGTTIESNGLFGDSIVSVILPEGLISIGACVFEGCDNLQSIYLPDSLETIGYHCFRNCRMLQSVDIPDGIISIGAYPFSGCNNLSEISVPDAFFINNLIINDANSKGISLAIRGGTDIKDSQFNGTRGLIKVTLGKGIQSIGADAFAGCNGIETIEMPNTLSSIGDRAFKNCSALQVVQIPEKVTQIGDMVFEGCDNLQQIVLPNNIQSIGENCFNNCSLLVSAGAIGSNSNIQFGWNKSIPANAFSGSKIKRIVLPDGIERIEEKAFEHCEIDSITIPSSVRNIDETAFSQCSIKTIYYGGTQQEWDMYIAGKGGLDTSSSVIEYGKTDPGYVEKVECNHFGYVQGNTTSEIKIDGVTYVYNSIDILKPVKDVYKGKYVLFALNNANEVISVKTVQELDCKLTGIDGNTGVISIDDQPIYQISPLADSSVQNIQGLLNKEVRIYFTPGEYDSETGTIYRQILRIDEFNKIIGVLNSFDEGSLRATIDSNTYTVSADDSLISSLNDSLDKVVVARIYGNRIGNSYSLESVDVSVKGTLRPERDSIIYNENNKPDSDNIAVRLELSIGGDYPVEDKDIVNGYLNQQGKKAKIKEVVVSVEGALVSVEKKEEYKLPIPEGLVLIPGSEPYVSDAFTVNVNGTYDKSFETTESAISCRTSYLVDNNEKTAFRKKVIKVYSQKSESYTSLKEKLKKSSDELYSSVDLMKYSEVSLKEDQKRAINAAVNMWLSIITNPNISEETKREISESFSYDPVHGIGELKSTFSLGFEDAKGVKRNAEFELVLLDYDLNNMLNGIQLGDKVKGVGGMSCLKCGIDGRDPHPLEMRASANIQEFTDSINEVIEEAEEEVKKTGVDAVCEMIDSIALDMLSKAGSKIVYKTSSKAVSELIKGVISKKSPEKLLESVLIESSKSAQKATSKDAIFDCPVDVYVYGDGILCGAIENDKVVQDICAPVLGSLVHVNGTEKIVFVEGDLDIKLVGTDTGTMEYEVREYDGDSDEPVRVVKTHEIPLSNGKTYTVSVDNELYEDANEYNLVDESGKIVEYDEDSLHRISAFSIAPSSAKIQTGETVQIYGVFEPTDATNKTTFWTSSNESVATVADGLVTAIAPGNAIITATTEDGGFTATCNVTVSEAVQGLWIDGVSDEMYTGTAITYDIDVYDGETLLREKEDYTISYKNNSNVYTLTEGDAGFNAKKAPSITVTGKGNYGSKEVVYFKILPEDISGDGFAAEDLTLAWTNKKQKINPSIYWKGKALKSGKDFKFNIYSDDDIEFVKPLGNSLSEPGEYLIRLTGINNFTGERTICLSITDLFKPVSKLSVGKIPNMEYTGKAITPEPVVKDGNRILTKDVQYTLSYESNTEVGTGYVLITGSNKYFFSGTKRVAFKIVAKKSGKTGPYDISTAKDVEHRINVTCDSPAVFNKSGAKPAVTLTFRNRDNTVVTLREGRDYKVSYKNNTVFNGNKPPVIIITGTGNFKGKRENQFTIAEKDISEVNLLVDDKMSKNKPNNYITKITLEEPDGKKLSAGKDYDKNISYTYLHDTKVNVNGSEVDRAAGSAVEKTDVIPVNTVIGVTVTAKPGSGYKGSVSGTYRIITASISSAKISIPVQTYTGGPITLGKDDIKVSIKGQRLASSDFEIVSYTNNIKKGTAKVTIRGLGNYGGLKTQTFKIKEKGFIWWWRLAVAR